VPVALAAAVRSPFAIADGVLAGWHPVDLTVLVLNAALSAAELDGGAVDEVIVGCNEPVGAQGADMARAAVLAAGWPDQVGGIVVDGAETSGSAALHLAAGLISSGQARTVAVAGVSSASMVQPGASALGRTYGRPWGDGPADRVAARGGLLPAPRAAELAAARLDIPRSVQDEWARRSHDRRRSAPAPPTIISVDARPGESVAIQRGSPVLADVVRSLPTDLAGLQPIFDADGTVTSASFAPAADGVTVLILARDVDSPIATLVGSSRSAGDPLDPVGGVARSVRRGLHAASLTPEDIDAWEISEPTAATALLASRALGLDPERTNRLGGTLAVGDAGAAEDLRLSIDRLGSINPGGHLLALSTGPSGAATTVWQRSK